MITRHYQKQTLHLKLVTYTSMFLFLIGLTPLYAGAQDNYVPIFESLQIKQKQNAQRAAPNGQDPEPDDQALDMRLRIQAEPEQEGQESTLVAQIAEKLKGVSLEEQRQTQELEHLLGQFGYDVFPKLGSNSTGPKNVPVPQGYRVDTGDTLIVQIYGKRNVEYRLVVTREGQLLIPEFGPVQVAGLSFAEISDLISASYAERVIGAKAVVTMGAVRNIQVRLTGDVLYPGVINVSGLSTLIDVLLSSGGIKYSGSLRNIQLKRYGKVQVTLDLYDLLLRGSAKNDMRLRPNDVIFVPPIGPVVSIGGDVQRPGIYEVTAEKTVDDAIKLAGGLLASASLEHSHVERIVSGAYRTLVNPWARGISVDERKSRIRLSPGDFIRILPMDEKLDGVVVLEGHVKRPGGYEYTPKMRFNDLLGSYQDFSAGADHTFALIKRELPRTGKSEIVYVDIEKALSFPEGSHNAPLQSRDTVKIFSVKESRAEQLKELVKAMKEESLDRSLASVFTIRGHSRYTGEFPLQRNSRLLEVLRIGGGILSGTDMVYGVVGRTEPYSKQLRIQSFSLGDAIADPEGRNNPLINPGDRIYLFNDDINRSELLADELSRLREQSSYSNSELLVRANGRVKSPGSYPLTKGMRLSDLLCAANGLNKKGFGAKAELSRVQISEGERKTVHHLDVDARTIVKLCVTQKKLLSELQHLRFQNDTEKNRFKQSLTPMLSDWTDGYADDALNPELVPGDELTFVEKPGWQDSARVLLSGEVGKPGTYVIERGETLCQVLKRASGLAPDAYPFAAEFTRVSVRDIQQDTLDSIQNQLDDLLVELSLSHSARNSEKTPAGNSKDEYIKIIRQLERAQPSGRMVVDVKGAAKCKKRSDIVLEDGDTLHVPRVPKQVYVSGQVYVPTTHMYRENRRAVDYINMSGGATVLGRLKDAYVMQANGEVVAVRRGRKSNKVLKMKVRPGAKIIVPLNVDRMNTTEKAQSWTKVFLETAILAGVIL
ncbi:MAG: SLBB domain-containing protein [Pseudomonadota bacterium]